jgi:hypothetical protein
MVASGENAIGTQKMPRWPPFLKTWQHMADIDGPHFMRLSGFSHLKPSAIVVGYHYDNVLLLLHILYKL